MTYETVELNIEEGIASLVLNCSEEKNPFGHVLCRKFGQLTTEMAGRHSVRMVIFEERGNFFTVGGDIGQFSRDLDVVPTAVRRGMSGLDVGMARLLRMDAPLVAWVHATAMGGAVSLVSNCDLVYSARTARFGAAYAHLGFICDLAASYRLASRMGVAHARRFLLLVEVLEAAEAQRVGLGAHAVEDEAVAEAARTTAITLSQGTTRAYAEIRRLLARSPTPSKPSSRTRLRRLRGSRPHSAHPREPVPSPKSAGRSSGAMMCPGGL